MFLYKFMYTLCSYQIDYSLLNILMRFHRHGNLFWVSIKLEDTYNYDTIQQLAMKNIYIRTSLYEKK